MNRDAKVFHCRRCGATLGVIERGVLVVGATRIKDKVAIECLVCANPTTWRPDPRVDEREKQIA
jgi:hypothetical protein